MLLGDLINTYSYSPASSPYKDRVLQGWSTRAGWLSTSHLSMAAPRATPTFLALCLGKRQAKGDFLYRNMMPLWATKIGSLEKS